MSNTTKHIEKIKESISKHPELSSEEKSSTIERIEEWYAEDKAFGTFIADLSKISPKIEAILVEMGLI